VFCPECGTWNRASAAACERCEQTLPNLDRAPFERPDDELTRLRRAAGARYRIMRRLGAGGMATVYVGEQAHLLRPVVIKVLHPHLAKDPEVAERFRREAEAASRLVHPHICPIFDYGATEDVVYAVMPYLEGGSLADQIQTHRYVPPARAAAVAAQVACGLDYAHRRGVIHRDVKPDNVLFDEDGNAVLTDFGIATARFHGRLTASGRAMGTPHYMSPEQAMGKLVDGRSDVYAVGIVLYEALLGTEQVHLAFRPDGVRRLAEIAHAVNEKQENIGARRLYTVMERLLEDVSFHAARRTGETIEVDAAFVDGRLAGIAGDDNLARYIL